MNGRERIQAILNGEHVSPKVSLGDDATLVGEPGRFTLTLVHNPFGRAHQAGIDVLSQLKSDPEAGNQVLDQLVDEARAEIAAATTDGILYRLSGASPSECSPMEYGGYFLERDRELLQAAFDRCPTFLEIASGEEAYIDFVSDLPAHAFIWDSERTGASVDQLRSLRTGLLACQDPQADFAGWTPAALAR
jgi:hypothetical protein